MIKFNDLGSQWAEIREEALIAIDELGTRGDYIGGKAISDFEAKFAAYTGSAFGVGISNGTDALKIAFQIFDLSGQDLVIMPANTFIADYLALKNLPVSGRATPEVYLVDHDKHFTISTTDLENFLSRKRNDYRQVVVVAVHLYGHPCDLQTLKDLKHKYDFILLEDCSQSHGTKSKEFNPGNLGEISVYSLYPGKNLGALGDAGILTTNDPEIYRRAKILRNYGSPVKYQYDEMGNNHRLDTLQAIVLSLKLDRLDQWNLEKQKVAERYSREINNLGIS
jgi:dTDP-4-amino-4,6-dideoxygalactose transaminase